VPKAVYPVAVVINTRPWWASILGPNTLQSSVLLLDHCDLVCGVKVIDRVQSKELRERLGLK